METYWFIHGIVIGFMTAAAIAVLLVIYFIDR